MSSSRIFNEREALRLVMSSIEERYKELKEHRQGLVESHEAQMKELQERQAVELRSVNGEHRLLTDRLWECRLRIREIDQEQPEVAKQTQADPTYVIDRLSEIMENMCRLIPSIDASQYLQIIEKTVTNNLPQYNVIVKSQETHITSTPAKQEAADEVDGKAAEQPVVKEHKYHDLKKQAAIITSMLKESGVPMTLKDIVDALKEQHGIVWDKPSAWYQRMKDIQKHEPRIVSLKQGATKYFQLSSTGNRVGHLLTT